MITRDKTETDRRRAISIWQEACVGKSDGYHAGNCMHCCLRGQGEGGTADGLGTEPNYAGWARVYVQAGIPVPARFAEAFIAQMRSDNTLYAEALARDIALYGVTVTE